MNELLNNKAIYRTYYIAITGLFVITGFSQDLFTGELTAFKVFTAIIVAAYISVLLSIEGIIRLIMTSAVAATIIGAIVIGGGKIREWFYSYVDTCFRGNTSGLEEIPLSYQYAQLILIIVAAGLAMIVIERIAAIKYIGALAILVLLITELIKESMFSHTATVLGIIYLFTVMVELIQKKWKKRCQSGVESYIVRLLPFVIIYMAVMFAMPDSEKPYDWHYTKGMYERMCNSLDKLHFNFGKKQEENYATSMAGFSDANSFFGSVEENNNIIMTVNGDAALSSNLYLVGRSYDTFYGRGWSQTREETSRDRFLDSAQLLYVTRNNFNSNMSDYISKSKVGVTFGNYHSAYTFMPQKSVEYSDSDGRKLLYTDQDLLKGIRRDYGDEYAFYYYQINMQDERIEELLEAADYNTDSNQWKELLGAYKIYDFSFEDKILYEQQLKADYSQDIVLSQKLQDWLEVNAGQMQDSGQDEISIYRKLRNLEAALNQFEYNTDPGPLPEDIDTAQEFLEYFVLESQSGFCTYYASAFTLLARAMGLPARYVEGFCVPMVDKTAKVTGRMAHAWSEVYIDGLGWMAFEPTPGYVQLRYTSWEGNSLEDQKEAAREKYLEYLKQYGEQNEEIKESENATQTSAAVDLETIIFICRLIGIVLMSIDVTMLLVMLISRFRYSRLTLQQKFMQKFEENLRLMSFMGIRKDAHETYEEFRFRVTNETDISINIDTQFLHDYESVCYGNHEVTQEFLDRVCLENDKFKKNLFVHVSKKKNRKK